MRPLVALSGLLLCCASPSVIAAEPKQDAASSVCRSGGAFPPPDAAGNEVESYRFEASTFSLGASELRVVRVDRRGPLYQLVIEEWDTRHPRPDPRALPITCPLDASRWAEWMALLDKAGFWTTPVESQSAGEIGAIKLSTPGGSEDPVSYLSATEGTSAGGCWEGTRVVITGVRSGVRRTRWYRCATGEPPGAQYAAVASKVHAEAERALRDAFKWDPRLRQRRERARE